MPGRLIAIVGPSGAGKDTLIDGAVEAHPGLRVARRAITRAADAGGENHEALSDQAFADRLGAGAFAFHWEAHGLSYGIPAEIDTWLADGATVLFNGSRAALATAQQSYPDLETVLVTAPVEVLARRLAGRGRESETEIAARLARKVENNPAGMRVVINDGSVADGISRFVAALNLSKQSA